MKKISIDGITRKYLHPVDGDIFIETTYVDYHNKHIVCFSSMAGCPIGCSFCASGYRPAIRILTKKEIIDQCENVIDSESIEFDKPILFSCMGEGEPLLNYKNVITALKVLTGRYPNSKIAISTTGVRPKLIERLAEEQFSVPLKLQVSIHSPCQPIRDKLIPTSKPLWKVMESVHKFKKSGGDIELNYVLFDKLNDSDEDAIQMAQEADKILIKLNKYNPIPECEYRPSTRLKAFKDALVSGGGVYEVYNTDGTDIEAACGQLTYKLK